MALATASVLLPGCNAGRENYINYIPLTGGKAGPGAQVIADKDCGSCHIIPGIHGANGLVGPPLDYFGRRTYIAGELPNTAENLKRWVQSPQSVEPKTAMPNLGLTDQQARDVVAYLYTLE